DFFNGLPEDIQQLILDTVEETRDFSFETQADLNGGALDKIIEDNPHIEVAELTDEEREEFREASQMAHQEYIDTVGSDGETILNQLKDEIKALEEDVE